MQPGSIVAFRKREWVVLPSDRSDLISLRPLTGATDSTISIHKQLEDLVAYSLPEERIRSANFPKPTVDDLTDAAASELLWQAARLNLQLKVFNADLRRALFKPSVTIVFSRGKSDS